MKYLHHVIGLCVVLLWGCAGTSFEPAATIDTVKRSEGYRASNIITADSQDKSMFIIVMFSGGGSRAAAFGYELLDALREEDDGKGGTLLDHVGLTFGVSGGAVISMYYALHGEDTFPQFDQAFLQQDFQGNLLERFFSQYLFGLSSPEYGRGDLLAKEFDEHVFHGATFGDIVARGKGPMSIISASDINAGYRFNFMQDYFDVLCLDLNQYSVARAVAASSAVPGIFSPITINNNAGNCHYQPTPLIASAKENLTTSEPTDLAAVQAAFSDRDKRPYLHLVDGGISDNLAMRTLLDLSYVENHDEVWPSVLAGHDKLVFISLDAKLAIEYSMDDSAEIPSLKEVLAKSIDHTIARYSDETIRSFERYLADAQENLPEDVYFIRLNLTDLPDDSLQETIQQIDTSFRIKAEHVDALKEAVSVLMTQSEEYQRLLESL